MITENLSTLKIHKLTQEQYDRAVVAGNVDPTALYLTPSVGDGGNVPTEEVEKIISDYLNKNEIGGKADLSVNNPEEPGYVANRSHWDEDPVITTILPDTAVQNYECTLEGNIGLVAGETYVVTINGVEYQCTAEQAVILADDITIFGVGIGNISSITGIGDNGIPFAIGDIHVCGVYGPSVFIPQEITLIATFDLEFEQCTVSVRHVAEKTHKIPVRYLPDGCPWAEEGDVPLDIAIDGELLTYKAAEGTITSDTAGIVRGTIFKVSDLTVTAEELSTCVLTLSSTSGTNDYQLTADNVHTETLPTHGYIRAVTDDSKYSVVVVHDPVKAAAQDLNLETGTYFSHSMFEDLSHVTRIRSNSVTVPGIIYHKIPEQYLTLITGIVLKKDDNGDIVSGTATLSNGNTVPITIE